MSHRVQLLLDEALEENAKLMFREMGLSVQEGIRMLVTSFVNGKITVAFNGNGDILLTPEAIRKYNKIINDIKENKNIVDHKIDSSKSFTDQLLDESSE